VDSGGVISLEFGQNKIRQTALLFIFEGKFSVSGLGMELPKI